ncbi:MAG TPA: hypothetical protein PKK96_14535 [Anaerolineales bacterium]|nr:hypothetical protein [Anaerolineales bacterium]HNQ93616.1 hypothetical protein [Anaerolineales bacterium]HNS62218.1 hypothetical protein [Anaerolineales bacterium]
MKIITNDKLIQRNGKIGGTAILLSIIILVGGFFVNINNLSGEDMRSFYITLASFVVGFILVQVGLYFVNRYGGKPRMDERLDAALKGLPGDFTIYHFTTPASHLLVGPAGVWALLPYRLRGAIEFRKNRWRVRGGGFLQAYMSIFGQEGIGRPDIEAEHEVGKIKNLLAKHFDENESPEVNSALVFTNEQIEIQAEGAPLPALKVDQLKGFFRQKTKEKPITSAQLAAVKAALPE